MKQTVLQKHTSAFQKAFTVVELLVVISVIGILAAIVIVSYSGSQQRANKASFNATGQQIKLKLGDYFTDNNIYPTSKNDVITYLNNTSSSSLATSFNTASNGVNFEYFSCVEFTNPANCNDSNTGAYCNPTGSPATPCKVYTIRLLKAAWRGDTTDSNLLVNP